MTGAESLRQRYGAPAVRAVPFLFIRDPEQRLSGMLICCPWRKRRGVHLSDQQLATVREIRDRIIAEPDRVPAVCWVQTDQIAEIHHPERSWLRRKIEDHPTVRIA